MDQPFNALTFSCLRTFSLTMDEPCSTPGMVVADLQMRLTKRISYCPEEPTSNLIVMVSNS